MSQICVIAPILFPLRLIIDITAIKIAALLVIIGCCIITLRLANDTHIQGVGQLSALVIGRNLRQHGPIDLDRTSSKLVPALQTRHLPGLLFKLRYDLCLLYNNGIVGYHMFGERSQIAADGQIAVVG